MLFPAMGQASPLDALSPHPVLPAPMVGLSHYAVRRALRDLLPVNTRVLFPTEMLSSRRLMSQKKNESPEVNFMDADQGLIPQLLGNEEVPIRESIKKLEDWGASAIDINMGCPVQKALKHNYGVALMGDADYAARVTEMAVKHSRLPVSVKLRAGLQNDGDFLLRFCRGLENAGASWITLHPRTADQKRRGDADWNQILLLKQSLSIPVVGNGDVQTLDDIKKMLAVTSCDRVMIGRAALGKPWLLAVEDRKLEESEKAQIFKNFLLRTVEYSRDVYPEENAVRKLKFLIFHSSVWLEFGHFLFKKLSSCGSLNSVVDTVQEFFSKPQRFIEITDRRR